MANGLNTIANLLGKVNANNALIVALDGGTATADRFLGGDGTAADPTFSFSGTGDGDNGMYLSAADTLGWSTGGTLSLSLSSTGVTSTVPGVFNSASLGVVPTAGLSAVNTTAAAVGAQQVSPAIMWSGSGWKTNATAAAQAVAFRSYVLPIQGAAQPDAALRFGASINGGAYTDYFGVGTAGAGASPTMLLLNSGELAFWSGDTAATQRVAMNSPGNGQFSWYNSNGSAGVGLDFSVADVLGIRTRAQTGNAQLYAASVRGVAVAFSAVPATPVEGMLVAVTDSSTDVWGATITGGGALHVLAYYNGTNWTVAGK